MPLFIEIRFLFTKFISEYILIFLSVFVKLLNLIYFFIKLFSNDLKNLSEGARSQILSSPSISFLVLTIIGAKVLNSPLIAVIGQDPTEDFGVMSRHEGDSVLYDHEFYSNILKGIFSIDLGAVGIFSESEKTGYKNMSADLLKLAEERGLEHEEDKWIMDKDIRIKRTQDIINALPYLSGGAKSASHLTDVTPKIIVLAAIDGGNHIFMNIVREEKGELIFDLNALDEVISDYSDIIKSDIFIGVRTGFLKDTQDKIIEYAKNKENVHIGTIKEITDKFSDEIPKLI